MPSQMTGQKTGQATGATTTVAVGWSRSRLLAILASAVVVALALVVGFGYAVYLAIGSAVTGRSPGEHPSLTSEQMHSDTALGEEHRDLIAAEPMLAVEADAMRPTTPTTQLADRIVIPEPHGTGLAGTGRAGTGPAGVPSGFPHTPEGAIGQLAALSQTVLTSMSVETAHRVYDDWAMPGGVGAEEWAMTQNVTAFLGAAGMGQTKAPGAVVTVIPAAAQVKGTDGPDWTVACVLFQVEAIVSSRSSIGYGHCERMQWNPEPVSSAGGSPEAGSPEAGSPVGGRWLIAPGTPPAPAPHTWPGSALALQAGWLTWTTTPANGPATGPAAPPAPRADANAPGNPSGEGPSGGPDTSGEPTGPN